jgi:hypothetical protein
LVQAAHFDSENWFAAGCTLSEANANSLRTTQFGSEHLIHYGQHKFGSENLIRCGHHKFDSDT